MLHIVLFEPEIPQNTGNIMRTCGATQVRLHLIKPLGFSLDESSIRRSAMDYRDLCEYTLYDNYEDFLKANQGSFFYITRYGQKTVYDVDYAKIKEDIYLVFGKESAGLPKPILQANLDHCLRLPMHASARSLNLSNCVAIVIYEVLRQNDFEGLSKVEVFKGADFINQ
jgi:tRNA (cytidine/uridine-2'-O-)-methyltransferase